jgi:hypothetical protein
MITVAAARPGLQFDTSPVRRMCSIVPERAATGYRTVVVLVEEFVVPGLPGVVTSVPTVSFSIITPLRPSVRFVVVETFTSRDAGTGAVVSVVVVEVDDCAMALPDITASVIVATNKVFIIMASPSEDRSVCTWGCNGVSGGSEATQSRRRL